MGLLGDAIGLGLGAVGTIFGGKSASSAMRNVKDNLNRQRADNKNWYDRRYDEDATQRAQAQAMITHVQDDIRTRNRQAAGTQAVMGGTEESTAAAKAANNQALADVASNVVVNGERRKDSIEAQYQAKDEALQSQLNDLEMQKAGEVSQAGQGAMQAGLNIASIL
ncbi:MAG: hypothetical protein NC411_10415 [Bacteroides sp.]|nr:hypothetical protein [Bacteroides sp.]